VWRGTETTPKSKAAKRTLHYGLKRRPPSANDQWRETRFNGDTGHVFAHPQLGRSIAPARLTRSYLRLAMAKAGIRRRVRGKFSVTGA
jgi:hypothetical protein